MKETSLFFFLIQQALERQRTAEKERLFLVYAKQWWREFLEIRPSHQSKMVKIFAQVCGHLGGAGANRNLNNTQASACTSVELSHYRSLCPQDENGVNRPVCSYVRVLRAGRLLESPRHAARFVSLLAYQRAPVVGGGSKQEQWCTLMAFLCRQKVDTSPGGGRMDGISKKLLHSKHVARGFHFYHWNYFQIGYQFFLT